MGGTFRKCALGRPQRCAERTAKTGQKARQGNETMIELPVYNKSGAKVDTVEIDETTLGGPEIRSALLRRLKVVGFTAVI